MLSGRGLLVDTAQKTRQPDVLATFADQWITKIVLTHFHDDHSGNANALRQQHHCPVLAGDLTAQRVANGFPVWPYERFWFGPIDPCPAALSLPDQIITEHYQFTPISTLGHSDDHYVLLEPNQGWLFAGDFYVGNLKILRRGENVYQQIEAARQLLRYPFDTLLCGHNPVLTNGRQAIVQKTVPEKPGRAGGDSRPTWVFGHPNCAINWPERVVVLSGIHI